MKKKLLIGLFIAISIFLITGCDNKEKHDINEGTNEMKAVIDGKEYIINLENNATTKNLVNMLPKEYKMNDLHNNEKYIYINESLPTNSSNPGRINAGDVMLYGDNCIVIFYKSFDTEFDYTKIGHIDNLPDLGSGSITVKFEK